MGVAEMKKKILIVDDDKDIHALLRTMLGKEYELLAAVDAIQGVSMAKQAKPDLVILDVQMPAGGGPSVFDRLSKMGDTFTIPILVMTALPIEEALRRIPGLLPERVLSKPFSIQTLREAVAQIFAE